MAKIFGPNRAEVMMACYNNVIAGSLLLVILESKHNNEGHIIYTLMGKESSRNGRNVKRMQGSGENTRRKTKT